MKLRTYQNGLLITPCAHFSVISTSYGKLRHNCTSHRYLVPLAKYPTANSSISHVVPAVETEHVAIEPAA